MITVTSAPVSSLKLTVCPFRSKFVVQDVCWVSSDLRVPRKKNSSVVVVVVATDFDRQKVTFPVAFKTGYSSGGTPVCGGMVFPTSFA